MLPGKTDIINKLKREILTLQGFKTTTNYSSVDTGLGPILDAFPNASFPLGAIHEFICEDNETVAASSGFISGLVSSLMRDGSPLLWIGSVRSIYPAGLACFGIEPDRIIFIDVQKEPEIIWALEESLKCETLAAVICEIRELSFKTSRRLQLAVEQSHVTGFIIRPDPNQLQTTASVSRWSIASLPGELPGDMPGVGFPRWKVELLRIRNGKPGNWIIEWNEGRFRHIQETHSRVELEQSKSRKYA